MGAGEARYVYPPFPYAWNEWIVSKLVHQSHFKLSQVPELLKGFQFYKLELNQGHSYIDIFPRIQLYFVNGSAKHRIIIVLRVLYDLGHAPGI